MFSILPIPMASGRPTLQVAERSQFGSRTTRRLRRDGLVPGIVYTGGEDARPFQVPARELSAFLSGGTTLFDVSVEGADPVPVVVKEEQRHPVRGEIMHIDFHQVDLTQKIEADVTVVLEGVDDAPGVKDGGVMDQVTNEVTVFALPADIPEEIPVDVSHMEIGDTLQLDTVSLPADVEHTIEIPEEWTIATLNPPPTIEETEPDLEEETVLVGDEEVDDIEPDADGADDAVTDASSDSDDEG